MNDAEMADAHSRGYHRIPDGEEIQAMSYIRLSEILHSCDKDSTKYIVIEREMKKHLAKDQAEINRKNIILGACMGGIFGLSGVVLGTFLRTCPACDQVAPSSAVYQTEKGNLAVKPPIYPHPTGTPSPAVIPAGQLAPSTPPATQPANHPEPVQSNAKPRKPNP